MRPLVHLRVLTLLLLMVSFSSPWAAHNVGERPLEELPIWNNCCGDHDCVPQKVKIIGQEGKAKIPVEIEGVQTKVDKRKLSPVPSARTWVCYFDLNGKIVDENIRCILYPEKRGTVNAPPPLKTPDGSAQAQK